MPRAKKELPAEEPSERKAPPELEKLLEEFLTNPPLVTDYRTFRDFYARLLQCLMLKKVDSKMTNAATYMGSILLLGLDREKQAGMSAELERTYAQLSEIRMTPQQAALWLRQQSQEESIKLLNKIAAENSKPVEPLIEVEWEAVTPAEKRLLRMAEIGEEIDDGTNTKEI